MTGRFQLGVDTFGDVTQSADERFHSHAHALRDVIFEAVLADQTGIDAFGVGEHHRRDFAISAPEVVLAASAGRTERLLLGSAVTVLSTDDPVRVFERFSTLDAVSNGRAEVILGRGSFTESYPLFGFELADYDALFEERLAIIGGSPKRFRPYVDLYLKSLEEFGHPLQPIAVHSPGHVAETDEQAREDLWPHYQTMIARIGAERGWPPPSRQQFDRETGPDGALCVGSPETVAAKIISTAKALDLSRFNMKYSHGTLSHEQAMRSIELFGTTVAPRVREEIGGG